MFEHKILLIVYIRGIKVGKTEPQTEKKIKTEESPPKEKSL